VVGARQDRSKILEFPNFEKSGVTKKAAPLAGSGYGTILRKYFADLNPNSEG
jgi:hypothetical protein